ncbi:MAG: CoA-binding protein [Solirubrobacteraceae bacterium]
MTRTPPSAAARRRILRGARTIAVVGASSNPAKASHFVLTYLLSSSADYEVWPVTPKDATVCGVPAYASLAELPHAPNIVDVFRRADQLPAVARDAVGVGAKVLWLQLGLQSDEAESIAHAAGLEVVTNRCLKIEHARFHGGLHLAGFDTGVISARRARG